MSQAGLSITASLDEGKSLGEAVAIYMTKNGTLEYTPDPDGDPEQEARIQRGIKILKLRKQIKDLDNQIKAIEDEDEKFSGGARRSRKQGRSRKHKKTHRKRR